MEELYQNYMEYVIYYYYHKFKIRKEIMKHLESSCKKVEVRV